MDEFVAAFDVENVNPNPARFDQKKADAINAAHIRLLTPEDFKSRVIPYLQSAGVLGASVSASEDAVLTAACPLIQERITVLSEAGPMLGFLFTDDIVVADDAKAGLPANAKEIVEAAISALEALGSWETSAIQELLNSTLIETMGLKPRDAFGPLRTGISGRRISPPLFESMEILGKERSLDRLRVFASTL
jgi:glutamyl-tRNA synthetase